MEIIERIILEDGRICIYAKDAEENLYHDMIFEANISENDLIQGVNERIENFKNKIQNKK